MEPWSASLNIYWLKSRFNVRNVSDSLYLIQGSYLIKIVQNIFNLQQYKKCLKGFSDLMWGIF